MTILLTPTSEFSLLCHDFPEQNSKSENTNETLVYETLAWCCKNKSLVRVCMCFHHMQSCHGNSNGKWQTNKQEGKWVMVKSCYANIYTNRFRKNSGRSFQRLPKTREKRSNKKRYCPQTTKISFEVLVPLIKLTNPALK